MEPNDNLSPVEIQQNYFEQLPDCDWIKYEQCNRKYLLQNVAFALYGSPSVEGDMTNLNDSDKCLEGYNTRQREQASKVYEKLCEQSKFSQNNEDIYVSILLVVCAKPKPLKLLQLQPRDYWCDLHLRTDIDLWTTPVFRVRKCIPTLVGAKACRIYIDESARVYQDWESYLIDNTLPKCVLIAPEGGEYQGVLTETDFYVKLTVTPSPALGLKARVLSSADTVTTVASLGAIGVLGVAAFTPVAPLVLTGAAVATVATGVYGLIRSSLHLYDRSAHEQTIKPTDAEARGSWLNIAASTVGIGAATTSQMLAKSAAAGTNMTKTGQVLATSVEILRHSNLITGGAGVLNSLWHMITKYRKHGETPSKLELFQFSAATLFFFSTVVSNRTAKTIIEEAQANSINEYRSTLRSNRHRKIFDKLTAETRRTQGAVQGNTEVIKGLTKITNKDQYFADVLKINKDVNQHKLRISMTSDGNININAQHKFNPSDLYQMGKESRTELFSQFGPAPLNGPSNVPTRLISSTATSTFNMETDKEDSMLVGIRPGEVVRIGSLLIQISQSGVDNIASMLQNLSKEVYADLITVSCNMLSKMLPEEVNKLKLLSPHEDLISQVVRFVFEYLKHERPLGNPCSETDNGIQYLLKEFFQDGVIRQETIIMLKEKFMEFINSEIDKKNEQHPNKKLLVCPICQGVQFA